MAGDNQHYVPQFLQRGFASRRVGKTSFVWEYRPGETAREVRTRDSGAESQFYTTLGDTLVDDVITEAEQRFALLVQRLRATTPGPVDEPTLSDFLVHLEVRTRHLRQTFHSGADDLVSRLLDFMADTDAFIAVIQRRMANDPTWINELVIEELRKKGLPESVIEENLPQVLRAADELMPVFLEMAKPHLAQTVAVLRDALPARLAQATKDGHVNALKRSIHPPLRSSFLRMLNYRVVDCPGVPMILGDSITLFRVNGRFVPRLQKDDLLEAVFLPISSARLLIGENHPFSWDYPEVKRAIARCSFEYFIAHENSGENAALTAEIGATAAILSDQELEDMAVDAFRSMEHPQK